MSGDTANYQPSSNSPSSEKEDSSKHLVSELSKLAQAATSFLNALTKQLQQAEAAGPILVTEEQLAAAYMAYLAAANPKMQQAMKGLSGIKFYNSPFNMGDAQERGAGLPPALPAMSSHAGISPEKEQEQMETLKSLTRVAVKHGNVEGRDCIEECVETLLGKPMHQITSSEELTPAIEKLRGIHDQLHSWDPQTELKQRAEEMGMRPVVRKTLGALYQASAQAKLDEANRAQHAARQRFVKEADTPGSRESVSQQKAKDLQNGKGAGTFDVAPSPGGRGPARYGPRR